LLQPFFFLRETILIARRLKSEPIMRLTCRLKQIYLASEALRRNISLSRLSTRLGLRWGISVVCRPKMLEDLCPLCFTWDHAVLVGMIANAEAGMQLRSSGLFQILGGLQACRSHQRLDDIDLWVSMRRYIEDHTHADDPELHAMQLTIAQLL
jgi:hypothetical protein